MAITSLDGYIASRKDAITWMKTGTRTLVAAMPYTVFDIAGEPGAGVLNVGNTANGLVHTSATAGYPKLASFGGLKGYLSRADFDSSVACRLNLFDRLFVAGAYAYNANTTLTAQPSFAGRVPNANYNGLVFMVEAVTAFTGNLSVQLNYLDQDGGAGDTGVIATGVAPPIGRCVQIPLAAGDSGIQRLDQVRFTVSTAGTANVMILRPLWAGRVVAANWGDIHDLLKIGLPEIYDTSALYVLIQADSTAVGLPHTCLQVAVG